MSVDPIARHLKHRYSQRRLLAGVTLISLKGTVSVILSDPPCKERIMPCLQQSNVIFPLEMVD